jgi:hypothetical protein
MNFDDHLMPMSFGSDPGYSRTAFPSLPSDFNAVVFLSYFWAH